MEKILICKACKFDKLKDLNISPDGRIFQCLRCQSLFISTENYFIEKIEEEYGTSYRSNLDTQKPIKLYQIFQKYFQVENNNYLSLLDIGCGDGAFLKFAMKNGLLVCGLDCDYTAIENLKKEDINCIYGKLGETVAPSNQKFDIITLWDVIEHIDNIESALLWLSQTIQKNGTIILITPNAKSILDTISNIERRISFLKSQKIMNICLNRYHLNRFTTDGLVKLFNRFGFTAETIIPIHLFSLKPNVYLNSFAPGIKGLSSKTEINKFLSWFFYKILYLMQIKNKILFIARKST